MYLQINKVKYDADWEIKNIYENLQIVWSQFFTDMLLIHLYLVYFKYLLVYRYSDSFPMNTNEHLFGHFQLFIIFAQVFNERTQK
jgi:hypothetical protein